MKYQLLGDHIYIPKLADSPLEGKKDIKFNYYLSSRVNGKNIDLDITTKLFDRKDMYVRKSCYRVTIGEIENCVKENLIDHMRCLGVDDSNIPPTLTNKQSPTRISRSLLKNAYSD
ncbi:hypothetical protein MKO06_00655 [Gramella sp. GC03-9]|uniref:Uncharacterized protein n=1 Tax=Christiangramia oceanisediminis TaxID=2920386 RepID=A0A9X2I5R6_9FLAO|nr:hypothetical protein [Gramella oceanisediminis]MCP9198399.1 hypothetical protein [Gramella oceanisediminis]